MTSVYVDNTQKTGPTADARHRLPGASRAQLSEGGGQGGALLPAPEDRLPGRQLAPAEWAAVWWLVVHGGAGESTLEELFSGSRAAGHARPLAPAGESPASAVLLARTHAHGLRAAQRATRGMGRRRGAGAAARTAADRRRAGTASAPAPPAACRARSPAAWAPCGRCRGSRCGGSGDPPGPANAPKVLRRLLEDLARR